MEAAGDLVPAVAELAAGMQHRQHQSDSGDLLNRVLLDGDATTIVGHPDATVVEEDNVDLVAVPGQGLIDGVVDDLVDQVVQATFPRGADVHAGAFANRLQTLQDRDLVGVIGGIRVGAAARACLVVGFQLAHQIIRHAVLPFHETAVGEPTALTTIMSLPRKCVARPAKTPP